MTLIACFTFSSCDRPNEKTRFAHSCIDRLIEARNGRLSATLIYFPTASLVAQVEQCPTQELQVRFKVQSERLEFFASQSGETDVPITVKAKFKVDKFNQARQEIVVYEFELLSPKPRQM